MTDALYAPDGERFLPTHFCRGPWRADAQHGGAPAALLARAVERFDGGDAMQVARLTVELLRPVPLTPLTVAVRALRPGKKVQLIEASLLADDVAVSRVVGLRLRRAEIPIPEPARRDPSRPPGPDSGHASLPPWATTGETAYHSHAVEHRSVVGSFERPGPATDWIRLRVPVVAGEATSPLCRVAAVADFGNGVSWVLPRQEGYSFINPDLTIYLRQPPVGEWVCLEAVTWIGPHGAGLAESRLWDERALIGRAAQSLLVERG
jgi:hypothetical protein